MATSLGNPLLSVGMVPVDCDRALPPAQPLESAPESAPRIRIRKAPGKVAPPGALIREIRDSARGGVTFRTYESVEGLQWDVAGVGRFSAGADGRAIFYGTYPGAVGTDIENVLLGPVLGMALQNLGRPLLHAGAILHDQGVIAFTAPSGFGKSTLAATFARDGYELVADDILPLIVENSAIKASTYIPRLKLWDDAIAALGGEPDRYDRVLSWIEKRNIWRCASWARFADPGPHPLSAVYVLVPMVTPITPTFDTLNPSDAVLELMRGMYMGEVLRGPRLRTAFEAASLLAATTPVRRVMYYRDRDRLKELAEAILDDAGGVRGGVHA